jgi:hypothetical protein
VGNSFKAYDLGSIERGALRAKFSFYGPYRGLVGRKLDRLY